MLNKTLPLAYSDGQFGVSSARACLLAMLVAGDVHGQDFISYGAKSVETYVAEIESLIPEILREATLDGFEALTLLVSFICIRIPYCHLDINLNRLYTSTSSAISDRHHSSYPWLPD